VKNIENKTAKKLIRKINSNQHRHGAWRQAWHGGKQQHGMARRGASGVHHSLKYESGASLRAAPIGATMAA